LQAKLTISYAIFSVAIALIFQTSTFLWAAYVFGGVFTSPSQYLNVVDDTKRYAPAIAYMLSQHSIDRPTVFATIDQVRREAEDQDPQHDGTLPEVTVTINVVVTDASGRVVVSSPQGAFRVGDYITNQVSPREKSIIEKASMGVEKAEELAVPTSKESDSVAIPAKTLV
jgi:hypothetical protein